MMSQKIRRLVRDKPSKQMDCEVPSCFGALMPFSRYGPACGQRPCLGAEHTCLASPTAGAGKGDRGLHWAGSVWAEADL